MTAYLLKRFATGLLTLVVASVVVFSVLEILPGDPARLMLGINATEDAVQALRVEMGLDQGFLVRYFHWTGGLLSLDFGRSYTYSVPVIDLIAERAAVSLPLALISLALSTAIAIPVGVFAAARRGRPADTLAMGASQFGVAVPNFWFALAARLCVRRLAAAGSRRRLSRLERRSLAGTESADPAGCGTRPAPGGHSGARDAIGFARRSRRGFHPYRARQGACRKTPCSGGMRCATPCCRC